MTLISNPNAPPNDFSIGKIELHPDAGLERENQELRIEIEMLSKALQRAEATIEKLKKLKKQDTQR